jgi:hypothetical protein
MVIKRNHSAVKFICINIFLLAVCLHAFTPAKAQIDTSLSNASLQPPFINTKPLPHYDYDKLDYGMNMGLEQTRKGRFWCCWTAGGDSPDAFMVLIKSDDKGKTWSKPVTVVDAHVPSMKQKISVQNGTLWTDPLGRLWFFFDQSMTDFDGRAGIWYSVCDNPDATIPQWSHPVRIWHGTTKSKPIVLSTGEWILPVSLLNRGIIDKEPGYYLDTYHELDSLRMAHFFVSTDLGATWQRRGGVKFPNPSYDEHYVVERKDGSLWMTARTNDGIWESLSFDKGWTWTPPQKYLEHISSRHFIRRLQSGRLLLIKHGELNERTQTRSKLMAFLSEDEGKTWEGGLMLDERRGVSYPDGFQASNGKIYISYDRNRATDGFILMAVFTEEDILKKRLVHPSSRLKQIICRPEGLDKLPAPSDSVVKTNQY